MGDEDDEDSKSDSATSHTATPMVAALASEGPMDVAATAEKPFYHHALERQQLLQLQSKLTDDIMDAEIVAASERTVAHLKLQLAQVTADRLQTPLVGTECDDKLIQQSEENGGQGCGVVGCLCYASRPLPPLTGSAVHDLPALLSEKELIMDLMCFRPPADGKKCEVLMNQLIQIQVVIDQIDAQWQQWRQHHGNAQVDNVA